MKIVATQDVVFEPSSRVDETGRIFHCDGGVYRAISPAHAAFYRDLVESAGIEDLFLQGLVPTRLAPFTLEGYSLVLDHQRVPFVSYCMEWPAEMLRDAALVTCKLSIHLLKRGLTLRDAHPWNVLFDGAKPLFIDWGSILPRGEMPEWPYEQFRERFLWPLCLMAAGKGWLARRCMGDMSRQLGSGDVLRLMLGRTAPRLWLETLRWTGPGWRGRWVADPMRFLQDLRRFIEGLPLGAESTEWTDYRGPADESLADATRWSVKTSQVAAVLDTHRPATVLDVGASRGWYSRLSARQGGCVAALDVDEPNVSEFFRRVRHGGERILPLWMDFLEPTPSHGLCHGYTGAAERLQAEMVLGLAVTHHWVFKRGLDFGAIAAQFAAFARRFLLVEFVPPTDEHVRLWLNSSHGWYTLENFRQALAKFFTRVQTLPSSPAPRLLLLCEKG